MNILIIGSGGREHALAWQVKQSLSVKSNQGNKGHIYVTPGNGGTAVDFENLNVSLEPPFTDLIQMIEKQKIDLVIVGPEEYLSNGIVDSLTAVGIKTFGPTKKASRLEASKSFAKQIMKKAGVSTAHYQEFHDYQSARQFIEENRGRWVFKADGLCAGKGVVIPGNQEEALATLGDYFIDKRFGAAGEKVIIEEFLEGQEASVLSFCDGHTVRCLPAAQDHKRIFDGDLGDNTGGMGVYTPVPFFQPHFYQRVEEEILLPTIKTMNQEGIPFRGILYAGLMIKDDSIKVVEFNVRFGDPECQCVLPLLDCDFIELINACIDGKLDQVDFKIKAGKACTVVMASGGYPGRYGVGYPIKGLNDIDLVSDASKITHKVFHAGTAIKDNQYVTAGGRVLSVNAYQESSDGENKMEDLINSCYQQVEKISFTDCFYRRDIGSRSEG